jgi:predicted site-specific integrase-resolvase
VKSTITLQGRDFDSRQAICERFEISMSTLQRWKTKGWLPTPRRFGKAAFYDRLALEARLALIEPLGTTQ